MPRAADMAQIVGILMNAIEDQKGLLEPEFGFRGPRQIRTRGMPLYYISREQLMHLVEAGYTKTHISQILHVSTSVLKRRLRWGFVVHGGIDAHSRVITFLRGSPNKKSATMLESFLSGTEMYGVPSRVRSDHGLENTGVGAFMIGYRGAGRGSFITGRSVHNQRIERMWRDMYQSCTHVFSELFHHLEQTENLNHTDAIQRWSLHMCSFHEFKGHSTPSEKLGTTTNCAQKGEKLHHNSLLKVCIGLPDEDIEVLVALCSNL